MVGVLQAAVSRQRRGGARLGIDSSLGGDSQQSLADTRDEFVSKRRLPKDRSLQPLLLPKCRIFLDAKAWQERGEAPITKRSFATAFYFCVGEGSEKNSEGRGNPVLLQQAWGRVQEQSQKSLLAGI